MAIWLVRAGKSGEREELALSEDLVAIGWDRLDDLSQLKSREAIEAKCALAYPEAKLNTIRNWARQLWAFLNKIKPGDLIVLPLKKRAAIAIGKVKSPYLYRKDLPADSRHTRAVDWIKKDIPRGNFDQDILHSFGAFLTVCQIQRHQAEDRIRTVLAGNKEVHLSPRPDDNAESSDSLETVNLEEYALDQIRSHIAQKFRGHNFARLVDAVLQAEGFQTEVASPGPDGGVDIIAGRGAMGFDAPKLCVQVKSSDDPLDVKVLRELQGVMKNFGAQQGVLVAWGGFKQSVVNEARRIFFEIRLWDSGDLIEKLLEQYDHLPKEIQAELPLKRIWTLVIEE